MRIKINFIDGKYQEHENVNKIYEPETVGLKTLLVEEDGATFGFYTKSIKNVELEI